ncbi:MAG: DNA-packaging protein [Paracoccaceae bacterium]
MTEPTTTPVSALKSAARLIASAKPRQRLSFLNSLDDGELIALRYLFPFWAMPHQIPPEGDWRAWVILGGRGAGKTRAGAEWIRSLAEGPTRTEAGESRHIALVGDTFDQVRDVMIEGESGLLRVSHPSQRPDWLPSRKLLKWPNGAEAHVFTSRDPEGLRGPQFDAAWVDELAKWPKAQDTWDMLQFALRLGQSPRACVTTTPKNVPVLRRLLDRPDTVTTHATTFDNAANLAPAFLDAMTATFAGSRMGRQELDGVLLSDVEGALWTTDMLAQALVDHAPVLDRVLVAVDPPVTGHKRSDACGIVTVGVTQTGPPETWRAYVIEDATVRAASPGVWAQAAIAAYHRHSADRLVAEVNQGGEMVEQIIRSFEPLISFRAVRAHKGKSARAEPVAALYEQGRVSHLRGLELLEDEMGVMTVRGFEGDGSPDRVDALVWALHQAMILPAADYVRPRMRSL